MKETYNSNGKVYKRNYTHFENKEQAKNDAKYKRRRGIFVILDKDKNGWFHWERKKVIRMK